MSETYFNQLCAIWIAFALLLFPILLKIPQPYGKHRSKKWGILMNNKFGWFLMELPSLLIMLYFLYRSNFSGNLAIQIAGSFWVIHYFHRSIIFPFQIHTSGKKIPVLIVMFAVIFNGVNGFLNGYYFANFAPNPQANPESTFRISLGAILFVAGFFINKQHDKILISLRSRKGEGYKIPYGGWFRYISCPNFLGEIISWCGFALVAFSLPALSFVVWTMVNLIPRALDHHKWYKATFNDYPKERKAIFPFLL